MNVSLRVLFVDDNESIHGLVGRYLEKMGHEYESVFSGDEAKRFNKEALAEFDVAVVDWDMPGINGFETAQFLRHLNPALLFIMLTGHGTSDNITETFKHSFVGFLTKPVSFEAFKDAFNHPKINRCLDYKKIVQEKAFIIDPETCMVGTSKFAQSLKKQILTVASADVTVLIGGESGTGKEFVAKALHNNSPRKGKPFAAYNFAAITATLAETELFGYVKGAFTGAAKDTPGKIAAANGGTLFLDEIGDMPKELQSRLLRVLEEREVVPVGATKPQSVDVRIIAATHQDLEAKVAAKDFREDLYYRLNVVPLNVPPLRDRPEDLLDLVTYLHERARLKHPMLGNHLPEMSEKTKELMFNGNWPGNIRQLRNIVERASICGWDFPSVQTELQKIQKGVESSRAPTQENVEQDRNDDVSKSFTLDEAVLGKCFKRLNQWESAAQNIPNVEQKESFKPELLATEISVLNAEGFWQKRLGESTQGLGQFIAKHEIEFISLMRENPDKWQNVKKLEEFIRLLSLPDRMKIFS